MVQYHSFNIKGVTFTDIVRLTEFRPSHGLYRMINRFIVLGQYLKPIPLYFTEIASLGLSKSYPSG